MKMIKQLLFFMCTTLFVSCVWDTVGDEDAEVATTFTELEALDFDWQPQRMYTVDMDLARAHARVKPLVTIKDAQDTSRIVYRGRANRSDRITIPISLPPQKTFVIEISNPLGKTKATFTTAQNQTISIDSKPQSDR